MNIALISLNRYGDVIGENIGRVVPVSIFSKNKIEKFNITKLAGELMESYEAVIFISSTGIAIRAIAPFIKNKAEDPAVIVIDILGKYAISLLSGHLGGANSLTEKIAGIIGAEAVITTATDNLKLKAPDIIAKENQLIIDDLTMAKNISAILVDGGKVAFADEENIIEAPKGYSYHLKEAKGIVYVTNKLNYIEGYEYVDKLKLIRKNIIIGIGCRKNYSVESMRDIVREKLREFNIDERAVKIVASSEIKREEKAIIELSKLLKAQFKTFSNDAVKTVQHNYEGSDFVEKQIGVRAVCEPCVELSGGTVLIGKMKLSGMTLAIGAESSYKNT